MHTADLFAKRKLPTLHTERLNLRPFRVSDGDRVRFLAGNARIAQNTLLMPHPYPQGIAEKWIRTHGRRYVQGKEMVLAITASSTGMVVGSIGAVLNFTFKNAELGYWIGEEYWNRGYATEAARELVRFVFDTLPVHKIYAHCFAGNPASARVLENIGMVKEGVLKEHYFHWGEYKDLLVYGMRAHA